MTVTEARKTFGLKENDTVYKAGLDMLKKEIESHFNQTVGKYDKAKAIKELEAIEVLESIAQ